MNDASDSQIKTFSHGEEAEYKACVTRHGGYVLIERSPKRAGYMLHEAECLHLGLEKGAWEIDKPRSWAKTRQPLIHWATGRTGTRPRLCRTCM